MKKVTVKNMISTRGNKIANQFIITDANGNTFFQSYETTIVKRTKGGKIFLDKSKWDCSLTTGKYRNIFLGEKKSETQKKINSGEYKLIDLNK